MAPSRFIVPSACLLVAAAGLRRARFSPSFTSKKAAAATNYSRICNQNPSCVDVGLTGDNNCCPTDDGTMLGCCDGPAPAPNPRMCSTNQGCVDVGLTGDNNCCPTDDGMMLECCDGPAPVPSPAPTLAPTPASEQCPEFKSLLWETDMSGTYLAQHDGVGSGDECCSFCDEMAGCEGFSYNAANRACYLKSDFIGTFWNGGAVTRLKSSLGAGCPGFDDAQEGKDLVGTLIEQWAAPDLEACCASCARKEACQGFTFFDSRCYLKAAVGGTYDNAGRITRVKAGVLPSASIDEPAASTGSKWARSM